MNQGLPNFIKTQRIDINFNNRKYLGQFGKPALEERTFTPCIIYEQSKPP